MENLVTVEELQKKLENGNRPVIIDVRTPEAFENGHLPGAINIPRDQIRSALMEIPMDQPVVLYCNMYHPGVSRSEEAAATLRDAGYNARVLEGGFPEWENAGFPVENL